MSEDSTWAHCTREEFAGKSPLNPGSQAYLHRLKGKCPCGKEHAPAAPRPGKSTGKIVATYPYHNAERNLVMEVVRFEPKTFRQRQPKPGGGWKWNLKGVKPPLYRLPELLASDPGSLVIVVEGEKDADKFRSLGFVATCNSGGAGKWRREYADDLVGRTAAIVSDNDDVGRQHAEQVARSVHGKVASVKIVNLPDLPDHGDASDWLAQGGTVDALKQLIAAAPEWTPSNRVHHEANGDLVTERPERFNRTDLGNAKRLVSRFGDRLRYCKKLGTWLVWSGSVWEEDASGEIYRLAKAVPQLILEEPSEGDDDAKAQRRWSHATEAKKLIDSMIALAWSEPGVPVNTEELNGDPWLLNVLNGTLELRTGLLRRHRQADLITKIAPVAYDPAATCPRFLAFLGRIMAGNQNLVGFLQRALGSALTGDVSDHALFFFYGSGRNGKGTLLELFTTLLGNYATTVDSGLITKKRSEDHPTGLTDLDGRRFVSTEEVEDGKELAEALVKKLTGGNRIKARRMRQDYYEFPPTHKLFLAANHEPEIRGSDEGIWSRVKLVPFSVFIPVEERVKNLHEMLAREEGPGILAWAVQGCLEWQRGGLQEPPEVQKATEAYRTDMDTIAGFLADRCNTFLDHETLKTQAREPKDALYKAYTAWADASGCEAVLSARKFGGELQRRGYDLYESNGKSYRLGLTLKGDPDFVPPEKAF